MRELLAPLHLRLAVQPEGAAPSRPASLCFRATLELVGTTQTSGSASANASRQASSKDLVSIAAAAAASAAAAPLASPAQARVLVILVDITVAEANKELVRRRYAGDIGRCREI